MHRSVVLLAVLVACSGKTPGADSSTFTPGVDSADTPDVTHPYVDQVQAACTTGETGTPEVTDAIRLESTVTWTLDFDADAEAAGWTDCAYTRTFAGTQRLDIPHVCPHCDVLTEGEATMTEGFDDCYEPLFGGTQTRSESWGYAGSSLFRRTGVQLPLSDEPLAEFGALSGDGTPVDVAWDSEYGVNDDDGNEVGTFTLAAAGTVAWQADPTTPLTDPFGPRAAPYACGWECNDPGTLSGAYPLAPGAVMPNFRLDDQCGEGVDIHDFYGSYIVLDSAQDDCGPCLQMAEQAEAFRADMTDAGIPVRLVPLLGNGLGEVNGTPSPTTHAEWVDRFQPHDPVLADKGWGYAAIGRYLADHEDRDISWPAWIVVGPDMRVIAGSVGFSSWDRIGTIITDDWAARGETGPL